VVGAFVAESGGSGFGTSAGGVVNRVSATKILTKTAKSMALHHPWDILLPSLDQRNLG
jgi:hypothetical protein